MRENIQQFKELMKAAFDEHCGNGLYSLNVPSFHYLVKSHKRSRSLEMLDLYLNDIYNLQIKQGCSSTSQQPVF